MKKLNVLAMMLLVASISFSCCHNNEKQNHNEPISSHPVKLDLFFNFDGNCREAAEFYANVFHSEVLNLMTYGQAPSDPNYPLAEEDVNRICYSEVKIGDLNVMFMDMPSHSPFIVGNNISPTISVDDKDEVERIFKELSVDGVVYMELQQTFFGELYGMLQDKYGMVWQVLLPLQDVSK